MQRLVEDFQTSQRHACELIGIPHSSYRSRSRRTDEHLRKRLSRVFSERAAVTHANQEWALDFASDAAANGQRLRVLSVMDTYTRECLALEVDTRVAGLVGYSNALSASVASLKHCGPTTGLS